MAAFGSNEPPSILLKLLEHVADFHLTGIVGQSRVSQADKGFGVQVMRSTPYFLQIGFMLRFAREPLPIP